MNTLNPDTFAAIAGQVFNTEFIAYTATKPGYDVLAMIDAEVWLGGNARIEYATYNAMHNTVTIQCEGVTYDRDSDDTDTVSRVLSASCNKIESIAGTLIAA